jgi:drug/metabolite transporter (DMT)-like permease
MKRKFSPIEFLLGLIVIYGIYFVSSDFKAKDYEALVYGLTSAFFAAVFSVFNAKLAQKSSSYQITFYEMLIAFVFLSFVLMARGEFTGEMFIMRLSDFLWLLFLGVLCTSFAFLATIEVVKRLGAFTVSLSINLEPVYTIILAIVILNENEILGSDFYIGSIIIVLVVIANAIIKFSLKSRAEKNRVKIINSSRE